MWKISTFFINQGKRRHSEWLTDWISAVEMDIFTEFTMWEVSPPCWNALLSITAEVLPPPTPPPAPPFPHLCWASRTSPCRAASGRCATAPWRTRWRWSCTEGSPRRRSCHSSRRRPSPAQWELAVWRPDEDGCRRGFAARLEHAGKGKKQTQDRMTALLSTNVLFF